jgi:hypothetical protein
MGGDGKKKDPTPRTRLIAGKEANLFRDGERPIYLLPDGRFAVWHMGNWAIKKTLAAVEKLQTAEKRAGLPIFQGDEPGKVIKAVVWEERWIIDEDGKRHHRGYREWYVHDAIIAGQLEDLEERRRVIVEALDGEESALRERLSRVSKYDFEEMREAYLRDRVADSKGDGSAGGGETTTTPPNAGVRRRRRKGGGGDE